VEAYERGQLELSNEEAIALAVEALLVKKVASIWTMRNSDGKPSVLLAYPKLVKAANKMIQTNHSNKAGAHTVLGLFSRRAMHHSEAVQHFTKAIQL
jgi:hypothetical protein